MQERLNCKIVGIKIDDSYNIEFVRDTVGGKRKMRQVKKQKIIKALKEEQKKYKGVMYYHLDDLIKDLDGNLQYEEMREYVKDVTGIKVTKIGSLLV